MTASTRKRTLLVLLQIILGIAMICSGLHQIFAEGPKHRTAKHELELTINHSGETQCKEKLLLPLQTYHALKLEVPALQIIQSFDNGLQLDEIENLKSEFNDEETSVTATYLNRDSLQMGKEGEWVLNFAKQADLELITSAANEAILTQVITAKIGPIAQTMRVHLPEGSTSIVFDKSKNQLRYHFIPTLGESKKVEFDFELKSKPHLMSSLANIYANEEFVDFWTAKGSFINEGEQPLKNFRIRFRIAGHSGWSSWNRASTIYPGQTITSRFFPVLEQSNIASMTTSHPSMIEVEYEFESAAGEMVRETDSKRIEILARNQVVYSSQEQDAVLSWYDSTEYLPFILAAFVHSDDPAIQQLAGRVAGMAGGNGAYDDAGIEAFLSAMWGFLESNQIAYQSPPGMNINNTFGQNVKFGRDVLRNRAGTCIDLAILWASVAKAVGLKAHIMVVPGHAFPVIELNSGNYMPIETTMIGRGTFVEATQAGVANYQEGLEGDYYLVNIDSLQEQGIRSLDLPNVSDSYLSTLGFRFDAPPAADENLIEEQATPAQPAFSKTDLYGTWGKELTEKDGEPIYVEWSLTEEGCYLYNCFIRQDGKWVLRDKGQGTWSISGNDFALVNSTTGVKVDWKVEMVEDKLQLTIEENTYLFDRIKVQPY